MSRGNGHRIRGEQERGGANLPPHPTRSIGHPAADAHLVFDQSSFAQQFPLQFFLAGQREAIARGKQLPALVQDRIASDGLVFLGAEDQTDGGVVAFEPVLLFIKADIAIHLTDILMSEFSYFQVHQHNAPEQVVVEHQVDVEIFVGEADAVLARYEREAAAELQQELLKTRDDGVFKLAFVQLRCAR